MPGTPVTSLCMKAGGDHDHKFSKPSSWVLTYVPLTQDSLYQMAGSVVGCEEDRVPVEENSPLPEQKYPVYSVLGR